LKQRIENGDAPLIIDVRDESEWEIGHIAIAHNIPLRKLEEFAPQMSKTAEIVVHCRTGVRATKAMHILISLGFTNVQNLTGGIVAWAREVDTAVNV